MNIKDFKNLDKDDILEMLGIESGTTTSGVLWSIGLVVVGMVAGAATALLLAPKTGREFRESFARGARRTADDIMSAARTKVHEAQAERGE
jgi:hypothetical protein